MKVRFFLKKVSLKQELKDNIVEKFKKLMKFFHFTDKEIGKVSIEIEKTPEVQPKRGIYKTEIHLQTSVAQVNISAQSRTLKVSFSQAFKKLKQNLLKLHKKFHTKLKKS